MNNPPSAIIIVCWVNDDDGGAVVCVCVCHCVIRVIYFPFGFVSIKTSGRHVRGYSPTVRCLRT